MRSTVRAFELAPTCQLCADIKRPDRAFWNKPLLETTNFVVIPSLGSLVEGWLLIVPKKHYISSGALPKALHSELRSTTFEVHRIVNEAYGAACVFEHGAAAHDRAVGCGVNHAHVHVLPVAFNLVKAVSQLLPENVQWRAARSLVACQNAYNDVHDYLYVEQPLGNARIALSDVFGSQLFRRAIASELGLPEQFNWRDFPQHARVAATVERLKSICADGINRKPIAV